MQASISCRSPARVGLLPLRPGQQAQARPRAVGARAIIPPKGLTEPPREPKQEPPMFGFVDNAERLNSRVCMIAFFVLIFIEAIAGRGIFDMAGFTVGQGLGFEF